uniref:SER_THR_PHOSPHATASE domain-containing protein n=1 Tax=Caenorhabditis tropicalis TaxID=1561998 RepID=A0A1I7U653_9PELO
MFAIVKKKVYSSHAGPCKAMEVSLDKVKEVASKNPRTDQEASNMFHVLWADCRNFYSPTGWAPTEKRGFIGLDDYNAEAVGRILKKCDLDLIVRAHEVVPDGYRFFATQQLIGCYGSTNNKDNEVTVVLNPSSSSLSPPPLAPERVSFLKHTLDDHDTKLKSVE